MTSDAFDFDPNEFIFTGPAWFVGPQGTAQNWHDVLKSIVRTKTTSGVCPVVFTDQHQAEQFVERLPGGCDKLEIVGARTPADFASALSALLDLEDTRIAIDPGRQVRVIPIRILLDALDKFRNES